MKRSQQEVAELLIFGLVALLVATGVLWVVGVLLGLIGYVFVWLAGITWSLLRFIIPVAVLAAAVYFLVVLARKPDRGDKADKAVNAEVVQVEKRPSREVGKGTVDAHGTTATRGGAAVFTAPEEPFAPTAERTGTDELRMEAAPTPAADALVSPAPEADTAPVEPLGEPETRENRKPPTDHEEQAMPVAETTHADSDSDDETLEGRTNLRNELSEEQKAELQEDDVKRPE